MVKHHESIHGERLAMGWHLVWAVLCFNTLCFSIGVLAMVWPYVSVGKPLLALACVLVGQSVMSAGGTLWHILASLEHRRVIARMFVPRSNKGLRGWCGAKRSNEDIRREIRTGIAQGATLTFTNLKEPTK